MTRHQFYVFLIGYVAFMGAMAILLGFLVGQPDTMRLGVQFFMFATVVEMVRYTLFKAIDRYAGRTD